MHRWQEIGMAALGAVLLACALHLSGLEQEWEAWSLDVRFRLRPEPTQSSPVTVVLLRPNPNATTVPRLRDALASFLATLDKGRIEPRVVAVDILLRQESTKAQHTTPAPHTTPAQPPETVLTTAPPDTWQGLNNAETDILNATASLGTLVHPILLRLQPGNEYDEDATLRPLRELMLPDAPEAKGLAAATGALLSDHRLIPGLYRQVGQLGFINASVLPSSDSVILRSYPVAARLTLSTKPPVSADPSQQSKNAGVLLSLPFAAASRALCENRPLNECVRLEANQYRIRGVESRTIPMDSQGQFRINYRKRFLVARSAQSNATIEDTLAPDIVLFDDSQTPENGEGLLQTLSGTLLPLSTLTGRWLLVVDAREPDAYRTPFLAMSHQWSVHAQVMANIAQNDFLERWSPVTELGVACLLWLLSLFPQSLAASRSRTASGRKLLPARFSDSFASALSLLIEPSLCVLWMILSSLVLHHSSLWLPVILPGAMLMGSWIGRQVFLPLQLSRQVRVASHLYSEHARLQAALDEKKRILHHLLASNGETLNPNTILPLSPDNPAELARPGPNPHATPLDDMLQESRSLLSEVAQALNASDVEGIESRSPGQPGISAPAAAAAQSTQLSPAIPGKESPEATAQMALSQLQQELRKLVQDIAHNRTQIQAATPALKALEPALDQRLNVLQQTQESIQLQAQRLQHAKWVTTLVRPELPSDQSLEAREDTRLTESTGLRTCDPALQRLLRLALERYAPNLKPILILGETGVGKTTLARAIHRASGLKGSFIAFNCSNPNEQLLDAELLGYIKGAFTNAISDKKGLFESADGGTLFLDELGDMPLHMQKKLVTLVEDGNVVRLGDESTKVRKVSVRIIGATHRSLHALVSQGRFGSDLRYRLNTFPITIPPLRQRRDDILLITAHYVRKLASEGQRLQLDDSARQHLYQQDWPGNVRELCSVIDRLASLSTTEPISFREVAHALEDELGTPPGIEEQAGRHQGINPNHHADDASGEKSSDSGAESHAVTMNELPNPQPSLSRQAQDIFSAQEQRVLSLQQLHYFDSARCARDPNYPGEAAAAARHLNQLMAKALVALDWDAEAVLRAMSPPEDRERDVALKRRLRRFLTNLKRRISDESWTTLVDSVTSQYKAHTDTILSVAKALKQPDRAPKLHAWLKD